MGIPEKEDPAVGSSITNTVLAALQHFGALTTMGVVIGRSNRCHSQCLSQISPVVFFLERVWRGHRVPIRICTHLDSYKPILAVGSFFASFFYLH